MRRKCNRNIPRSFEGVFIPKELWFDEELTPTEILLLAEIRSLDHGEGCCASDEYLSDFLGVTKGHIKNLLIKLRQVGYLETVKFDGRKRWIKFRGHFKMTSEVMQKLPQKSDINDPEINSLEDSLEKEEKETKKKKKFTENSPETIEIYNAYPKKAGRIDALKKIAIALNKSGLTFEEILARTMKFARSDKVKELERGKIKDPATWFHKGCYLDVDDDPHCWDSQKRHVRQENEYSWGD